MSAPNPNAEFSEKLRELVRNAPKNKVNIQHVVFELELAKQEIISGVIQLNDVIESTKAAQIVLDSKPKN